MNPRKETAVNIKYQSSDRKSHKKSLTKPINNDLQSVYDLSQIIISNDKLGVPGQRTVARTSRLMGITETENSLIKTKRNLESKQVMSSERKNEKDPDKITLQINSSDTCTFYDQQEKIEPRVEKQEKIQIQFQKLPLKLPII